MEKQTNINNNELSQINNQEKYNLIEHKLSSIKKQKNNNKILLLIISLIIILMILSLIIFYYNEHAKINSYKNMMPRLTPDEDAQPPKSINEIFNSRQIYITDAKITPEYIKYIRPINETEEEKYQIRYSNTTTYIDKKIFENRPDQYEYQIFCNLSLQKKLIYNETIKYNNTPDISVIIPSYNKKNILLKSIRSIQNQKFANLEIIIINDFSTDNSSELFDYLLKTDPRVRIFHHMKNMGLWRSRLDGILYSRGKYIILFDTGDLYQDNYVLQNAYDVITKYRLDSCKFLFRIITSFKRLGKSKVFFHVRKNSKIVYGPTQIRKYNRRVFSSWGNIWNRLTRTNVLIKAIFQLNELMLNLYKNLWDDSWYNRMINRNSFSYTIIERVGYVYLQNGYGAGSPKSKTKKQKSRRVMEYIGFLYYNYNFSPKNEAINKIMKKLKRYNGDAGTIKLKYMIEKFEILNNLLEALIKDPEVNSEDKKYLKMLLKESKEREKKVQN